MRTPALLVMVLAACSGRGEPAARDAATKTIAAPVPPDAAIAVPEGAIDGGAAAVVVDPAARLREGRALAGKLKWREALVALDEAAVGGDVDALAELAFTAVLAGDARRAEAASRAMLDRDGVPVKKRATAYYHLGRAAELRGDLDGARAAYEESLALASNRAVEDRRDRLAKRRDLPAPPAPPCAAPRPTEELCACLAAEAAIDAAHCVKSHDKYGGSAWAVTAVARDAAPTYLVAAAGKGKVRVVAELGGLAATITRWNVMRGPDGAQMVRVDIRTAAREDALLCVTTGTPRCLAAVPLVDKVGTPAQTRRIEVALDATDERGQLHVTLIEGPESPADLLGTHSLW